MEILYQKEFVIVFPIKCGRLSQFQPNWLSNTQDYPLLHSNETETRAEGNF